MFKNMRIASKLALGFGLLLVLLGVIAYTGITRMANVQANFDEVVNANNVQVSLANDMRDQINDIARAVRNVMLTEDQEEMRKQVDRIRDARATYNEASVKLAASINTEAGKKLLAEITDHQNQTKSLVDKAMELGLANKNAEAAVVLFKDVAPVQNKLLESLDAMIERQEKQSAELAQQARVDYQAAFNLMLGLAASAVLAGVALAWIITRSITKPLRG